MGVLYSLGSLLLLAYLVQAQTSCDDCPSANELSQTDVITSVTTTNFDSPAAQVQASLTGSTPAPILLLTDPSTTGVIDIDVNFPAGVTVTTCEICVTTFEVVEVTLTCGALTKNKMPNGAQVSTCLAADLPSNAAFTSCKIEINDSDREVQIWGFEIKACVLCSCPEFPAWPPCTQTCGDEDQTRMRACDCPSPYECLPGCTTSETRTEDCGCCPEDCEWGDWTPWTMCPVSCGSGQQSRSRMIETNENECGEPCTGPTSETQECSGLDPVDCSWNPWGPWDPCSVSCDQGSQDRTRTQNPENECGDPCMGPDTQSQDCDGLTTVDCSWNPWGPWGPCSTSCDEGSQDRTRTQNPENECGDPCMGPDTQSQDCDGLTTVDCTWNPWGPWSACPVSCGGDTQERTRTQNPENECGDPCMGPDLQTQDCGEGCCPVDCVLGDWSPWGDCDTCPEACGTGSQERTRPIEQEPDCDGEPCEETEETQPCEIPCCPEDQLITWDCSNKGDITGTKFFGKPSPDEATYEQTSDLALMNCPGVQPRKNKVFMSINNDGSDNYAINIAPGDKVIAKISFEWKFKATVQVKIYETYPGPPSWISGVATHEACNPEGRCWESATFTPPENLPGASRIAICFPEQPEADEWLLRSVVIQVCPTLQEPYCP